MPSKFIVKSFLISAAGLCVGYSTVNFGMSLIQSHNHAENFERTIASSPILKLGADQISRDYYDIQIKNEFVAEKKSETSIIKVTLIAKKDLPAGLQYKWQLHKDMTSTDILTGQIDTLTAGTKQEFSLRVVGFSKEFNSHVNFLVFGQIGDHNLRRSVITSSRPEDSFEYIVEKAALNEQKTGKVQKLSNGKSVRKKFDLDKVVK